MVKDHDRTFCLNILAIDDDPLMLKLLSRMLANLGVAPVTTCDNGRASLEWINSPGNYPNLIQLDLNMPEMDGLGVHKPERFFWLYTFPRERVNDAPNKSKSMYGQGFHGEGQGNRAVQS